MITNNLGKIAITPKGQYMAGSYEILDLVTDNGSSYLSLKDNNVSYLTVKADWMVVAEKGNAFEFSDFTPEQIALLQQPASDAAGSIALLEGEIEGEEALRVTAETNRNNAEGLRLSAEVIRNENETDRIEAEGLRAGAEISRQTAEGLRQQAEIDRQTNTATAIQNAETAADDANDAAILANEKAGLANNAALLANEKAGLAATATTQANTARDGANNAAQTANEAATNISPAVINNEQVQSETYNVLNARITALEEIIRNMAFATAIINKVDVVDEFNIHGVTNLILKGTTAPSITPDFIGQFYINTTAGTTYQAKGIANAADWKQTSN